MHLYQRRLGSRYRGLIISVALFLVMLAAFVTFVDNTAANTRQREEEMIRNAITRAAVTCYTLEGQYPENLQYLIDNYGLSINTDDYIVGYTAYAENLMPEIFVAAKPTR